MVAGGGITEVEDGSWSVSLHSATSVRAGDWLAWGEEDFDCADRGADKLWE